MEHRRLADIFPISKTLLHQTFGDKPSPRHFIFQAAYCPRKNSASKSASPSFTQVGRPWLH